MFSQGFILPSKAKTLEMDVVPCGLHVLTPGPRRAKFGYSSGPWGIFLFSKENNYEVLVGFSVCLCVHSCWLKKLKILAWKSWFYKSRLNFEGKKNDMDITYIKNIHIDILMWTFIFPSDFFFKLFCSLLHEIVYINLNGVAFCQLPVCRIRVVLSVQ